MGEPTEAEVIGLVEKARALRPELNDHALAQWLAALAAYIEKHRAIRAARDLT